MCIRAIIPIRIEGAPIGWEWVFVGPQGELAPFVEEGMRAVPQDERSATVERTLQRMGEPLTISEIARESDLSKLDARLGVWALVDAGSAEFTKMLRVRVNDLDLKAKACGA